MWKLQIHVTASMLLYYMAIFIIRKWTLRSVTANLRRLTQLNGSLVLYKEMKVVSSLTHNDPIVKMRGITSNYCLNKYQARVGELLRYFDNKRVLSVFPKQKIDLSNWIGFSGFTNEDNLPEVHLEQTTQINLIIETNYLHSADPDETKFCKLEEYGKLQAWKNGNYFSLLVETDTFGLANLITDFMQDILSVEDMELIRIESVTVEGHPYIAGYTSPVPIQHYLGYSHLPFVHEPRIALWQSVLKRPILPESGIISCIYSKMFLSNYNENCGCSEHKFANQSAKKLRFSRKNETLNSQLHSLGSTEFPDEMTDETLATKKVPCGSNEKQENVAEKPPNVIIFSDSLIVRNCVKETLHNVLDRNRYTLQTVTQEQLLLQPWIDNTCLLVVMGTVPRELRSYVITYVLNGGHVLCICSDFLQVMLPVFRTAEVCEHELVHISYGEWNHVSVIQHIFCYQPSPDCKSVTHLKDIRSNPPETLPSVCLVYNAKGMPYELQLDILGTEETCHSPVLIMGSVAKSGGRIIFSQVHLETDRQQYEQDKEKFNALQGSDSARLAILRDLLSVHLKMECSSPNVASMYAPAYLLGRSKIKQHFLERRFKEDNTLKLPKLVLSVQCTQLEPPIATETFLPVFANRIPCSFSEFEYFQALKTNVVGQLVLYTEVLTSTMDVLEETELHDGLAVIALRQTRGKGRSGFDWLSPEGCAVFSVQLHISQNSYLGQHLLLLQHLAGLAMIIAVSSLPGYENLNLRLKWPNDIYVGNSVKIGGVLVTSSCGQDAIICNIGCGVNLDNHTPTTCINKLIQNCNEKATMKLQKLSFEKYLAVVFNQLEYLVEKVQTGNIMDFFDLYYKHWLHSDAKISVVDAAGATHDVTVVGIDSSGLIVVRNHSGDCFSVHPGQNSFDLFRGLIIPKTST